MAPLDPNGPTGRLASWVADSKLDDVPKDIITRAKYVILDGLACAIVGAHLPWSEKAAEAIFEMETPGSASIIGWDRKISPVMAALLNSTFIQAFELDDWHSAAPVHSEAIVLPALFAAVEHVSKNESGQVFSGKDFLLGAIVGIETGPRVGLGLQGPHILTMGWHSGAVFGPPAAATAVSKLLKLPAEAVEDALGIACTQACGLMSAQYESEVKRMQHGFAARNGLFAALLARKGYVGIKKVFERPYGGFLACFTRGNGRTPNYEEEEVAKDLGKTWQIKELRIKPYAAMAGCHGTVDCVKGLQKEYPEQMKDLTKVKNIKIEMGEVVFHHGGWKAERPILPTGAQMSNAYVGATQMIDRQVFVQQFRPDQLDRDAVWDLVEKTTCEYNTDFSKFIQRMTITFNDGTEIQHTSQSPYGVMPAMSNDAILEKWRGLVEGLIDQERRDKIEKLVLGLDECKDVRELIALVAPVTKKAF